MDAPTITLNGKTYTAPKPKMKAYREIIKFQEKFSAAQSDDWEALDEMEKLLALIFNDPEITAEKIDAEIDVDDFIALFGTTAEWIAQLARGKMSELPNAETPTVPT